MTTTKLTPADCTLRHARAGDREAIVRLAELDSQHEPAGALLVAESEAGIVAVLPLGGGDVVADPFVRTAEIVEVLRLRAAQLTSLSTNPKRMKSLMERVRTKPIYALISAAVMGLLVMPIAFAGAADGPKDAVSASVNKQVKKLKRQVRQLQRQVEDLSNQPGSQGPEGPQGAQGPPGPATGPAGGDLTGTFPNPLIGTAAVGTTEIANAAVGLDDLANNSVDKDTVQAGAVRSDEIVDFSVESIDLNINSVGGFQLRSLTTATSPGTGVIAGTPGNAKVSCSGNSVIIGGGFAWQEDEPNSIIYSAPSETAPNSTWMVRGIVASGSNTLYAWANCLAA